MIINSILDNDFYKFTMMYAVWLKYPKMPVTYRFINRSPENVFTLEFFEKLKVRIKDLEHLRLTEEEFQWTKSLNLLTEPYWEYLKSFRFNTDCVKCRLDDRGQLELTVNGLWHETILFEVPLLALISETYFEDSGVNIDLNSYKRMTYDKGLKLSQHGCLFSEFGTRRRRSYEVQKSVIQAFTDLSNQALCKSTYIGTSNVHFSRINGTKPIGTMAHEWIMGHAGMFGINESNTKALEVWLEIFKGQYSIALTDTYTREVFFKEFTKELASSYLGIRQDSGDPISFVEQAVAFYDQFNIDPKGKQVVFSDNLNVDKVLEIENHVAKRFISVYGIGTNFTNDIEISPSLSIVIKLVSIDEELVFKVTDSFSKSTRLHVSRS